VSFGLTLRVGFIWDDHEMIVRNEIITHINKSSIKHAFTSDVFDGKGDAYYRPAQTLMNMADYAVWKLNPLGYHITNLFFHAAAALLLLFLFRALFEPRPAFITAALFAVHPIVVEQLIIIAGRAELMAMAFTLAALVCCLRRNAWSYAGAAAFYALACLSKESGVILPLFLILLGWMNPKIKPPVWLYAVFAAVFVVYWRLRSYAVAPPPFPSMWELALLSVRELPTIFLTYVRIILFPVDLHSHRKMLFWSPLMFISPLCVVLYGAYAYVKRSRLAVFAAAWFLIGMLPKIPNFADSSLMLDHWGYVSAIGVFILIAKALVNVSERSSAARLAGGSAFSVLLTFWIFCSWSSIWARKTDYELYKQALRYPTSSVVRGNLALLYLDNGYLDQAEKLADEALAMTPSNVQARMIKERVISLRRQN
jgi:hypothetical protein